MCLEAALFLLDEKDLESDDRKDPLIVTRTLAEMVSKYLYISKHCVIFCVTHFNIRRLTLMMGTMEYWWATGQVMMRTMPMARTPQLGVVVRQY